MRLAPIIVEIVGYSAVATIWILIGIRYVERRFRCTTCEKIKLDSKTKYSFGPFAEEILESVTCGTCQAEIDEENRKERMYKSYGL